MKKYYINISTELNIYKIIEYCWNQLAIVVSDNISPPRDKGLELVVIDQEV